MVMFDVDVGREEDHIEAEGSQPQLPYLFTAAEAAVAVGGISVFLSTAGRCQVRNPFHHWSVKA
jgi:hypothetical protein